VKKTTIIGIAILVMTLTACVQDPTSLDSTAEPESSVTAEETQAQEPETTEPEETEPEETEPVLSDAEIRELVLLSYESFEALGMTETSTGSSDGVEYALLFDPSMEDYQAVLLNRSSGEAELIFETDYFTLFVIYLMSEQPDASFSQESPGVYLADDPYYGNLRFFVEDGLIIASEAMDKSYRSNFEYSVDEELKEILLIERQKLLDSFDE
jgi:hypothetical protein